MGKWARRHPGLCGSTSIAILAMLLLGLLGGAVDLGLRQDARPVARVRYRVFDQDFTEIQFLLNTAGGSNEHLKKGIEKAGANPRAVRRRRQQPPRSWGDWVRRLTLEEGRRLREQVVELIMLEARARVLLASQDGSEEDRRRSIERAIDRLDHAERIDPGGPIGPLRRTSALSRRARSDRARPARSAALPADRPVHLPRPDAPGDEPPLRGRSPGSGGGTESRPCGSTSPRSGPGSSWVIATTRKGDSSRRPATLPPALSAARSSHGYTSTAGWRWRGPAARSKPGTPTTEPSSSTRRFPRHWSTAPWSSSSLNQLDAAQRDLLRSIELGRDDLVALTSLGETLARMGRRAEAERYFAGLLAQNPSSLVVRVARGFTRIAADPAGARSDLTLALDQAPRHAHAHYGMALLMRATDPRKALEHLERCASVRPQFDRRRATSCPGPCAAGRASRPRRRRAPPGKPHALSSLQCRLRGGRLLRESQEPRFVCPRP